MQIDFAVIARALAGFKGVHRRFERLGRWHGAEVIDDYAHHPTEVTATLKAVRQSFPRARVHAVFQPHLFSRTRDHAEEFGRALLAADRAVVTAVYPSREAPIPGVTAELVVDAARASGHRQVELCPAWQEVPDLLAAGVAPGDVVITLGAGDVYRLAERLVAEGAAGGADGADGPRRRRDERSLHRHPAGRGGRRAEPRPGAPLPPARGHAAPRQGSPALRPLKPLAGALALVGGPAGLAVWALASPQLLRGLVPGGGDRQRMGAGGVGPRPAGAAARAQPVAPLALAHVDRALAGHPGIAAVLIEKRLPDALAVTVAERDGGADPGGWRCGGPTPRAARSPRWATTSRPPTCCW